MRTRPVFRQTGSSPHSPFLVGRNEVFSPSCTIYPTNSRECGLDPFFAKPARVRIPHLWWVKAQCSLCYLPYVAQIVRNADSTRLGDMIPGALPRGALWSIPGAPNLHGDLAARGAPRGSPLGGGSETLLDKTNGNPNKLR